MSLSFCRHVVPHVVPVKSWISIMWNPVLIECVQSKWSGVGGGTGRKNRGDKLVHNNDDIVHFCILLYND